MSTYFWVLFFTLFLALCAVKAEDQTTQSCVNKKMDACNQVVKKAFTDAASPDDTRTELQVYCDAMKALHNCVKFQLRDNTNRCKSDTLRNYYFIVLAYLGMDKIMDTCSQDVTGIRAEILEDLAPESIEIAEDFVEDAFEDNPTVTRCAKDAHAKCVKLFTGKEKQSTNLCFGVRDFIRCYQENKCKTDKISRSFAELITKMSNELINAFEANAMCTVHTEF